MWAAGEARGSEPRRWQTNSDFMLASLQVQIAFLDEYQSMLGQMRKELPPRDPARHGGWRLASTRTLQGDAAGKKLPRESRKILENLAREHAGTPGRYWPSARRPPPWAGVAAGAEKEGCALGRMIAATGIAAVDFPETGARSTAVREMLSRRPSPDYRRVRRRVGGMISSLRRPQCLDTSGDVPCVVRIEQSQNRIGGSGDPEV
jgi:hypothetical protein